MAEFCLDCWNKLNHTHLTQEDVILSDDEWDLCEGCAQMKPTIIRFGKRKKKILFQNRGGAVKCLNEGCGYTRKAEKK